MPQQFNMSAKKHGILMEFCFFHKHKDSKFIADTNRWDVQQYAPLKIWKIMKNFVHIQKKNAIFAVRK